LRVRASNRRRAPRRTTMPSGFFCAMLNVLSVDCARKAILAPSRARRCASMCGSVQCREYTLLTSVCARRSGEGWKTSRSRPPPRTLWSVTRTPGGEPTQGRLSAFPADAPSQKRAARPSFESATPRAAGGPRAGGRLADSSPPACLLLRPGLERHQTMQCAEGRRCDIS
jgi:hypothetical protein